MEHSVKNISIPRATIELHADGRLACWGFWQDQRTRRPSPRTPACDLVMPDSKQRFSSRVDNYVKYRPGYPPEIIRTLATVYGLTPSSVVADIASGTGLFTRLLLENGNHVFAIEPNAEMRDAGEKFLSGYPKLTILNGS